MRPTYYWLSGVLIGAAILVGVKTQTVKQQVVQPAVQKLADAVIETTTTVTSTTLPHPHRHPKAPRPKKEESNPFKKAWNAIRSVF